MILRARGPSDTEDVSPKTARSSALTIAVLAALAGAVNAFPAGTPMTFQKYPDGFAGPVAPHAVVPLWRESVAGARYTVRSVRCAAPAAVAAGTKCFVTGP